MRKAVKIWCLAASVLVVLGLIIFAGAMHGYGWDFSKLSTVTYETNTYEVSGNFDRIAIHVDTTEITFVATEEETCRIVCYEMELVKHIAAVQDGVLTIRTVDRRNWYDHIGISFGTPKMTVYLPKDKYESVFVKTDTGDLAIPGDFSFGTLTIETDTADVDCLASVSGEMKIETDTGHIKIEGITAKRVSLSTETGDISLGSAAVKNGLELETDTGRMNLTEVRCGELRATSDTGDINLEDVAASGKFLIETDTGDVRFDGADAQEIFVETETGDVKGNLLTEKVFITETDTGRVRVPETTTGGKCRISTDTGDIILEMGE